MLPRWHVLLGILFALLILIINPNINKFYIILVFLASVFIDFDHYLVAVNKTGKAGLFPAFDYYKRTSVIQKKERSRGIRRRGDFHVFHTLEFHLLVLLLGFLWIGFLFIFIGMLFHSLCDIVYLIKKDYLYRREFFLVNWIRKKI